MEKVYIQAHDWPMPYHRTLPAQAKLLREAPSGRHTTPAFAHTEPRTES